jgi:hypothetical protein
MKALTIHRYHGADADDFFAGVEGEIAIPPMICDNPNCGCDRSYGGLNSHSASSTVMVREIDLDLDELTTAAVGFFESAGWADMFDSPDELREAGRKLISESVEAAADFDPGTVPRVRFDRQRDEWHYIPVD